MTRGIVVLILLCPMLCVAQQQHEHAAPEKLGSVSFPTSCNPATQPAFNRAVALLHSFAYKPAEEGFRSVAERDPQCAIAQWGMAMTHYHQLWQPALPPAEVAVAQKEIAQAALLPEASERERGFIDALRLIYEDASTVPYETRALQYESAMRALAAANPNDVESQVFYALAMLANLSPSDKQHRRQKQAADLLEPLYRRFPDHPGIPHYLIHACDNQEMAAKGLAAARAYAHIAPSAPHALHMPSHIFTRLGLWDDSIASNLAAERAAHQQGDTGEELHAMDYLVYAYLQSGRDPEALAVIQRLKAMQALNTRDFKVGYAATAMPVRYLVERQQWSEAEKVADPPEAAPPHVLAIAVWARGSASRAAGMLRKRRKNPRGCASSRSGFVLRETITGPGRCRSWNARLPPGRPRRRRTQTAPQRF